MKKISMLILLAIFCITTPGIANTPPTQNPDTESPPDTTTPVYAHDDAPFREREEPKDSFFKRHRGAIATVGTLAAITVGLIVSGADTGKHYHTNEESH